MVFLELSTLLLSPSDHTQVRPPHTKKPSAKIIQAKRKNSRPIPIIFPPPFERPVVGIPEGAGMGVPLMESVSKSFIISTKTRNL